MTTQYALTPIDDDFAELNFQYSVFPTAFGQALLVTAGKGIIALHFFECDKEKNTLLAGLQSQWPTANFSEGKQASLRFDKHMQPIAAKNNLPISLYVRGTPFQLSVWQALLTIPTAVTQTYTEIAQRIGKPKAVRAVGSAIGANPIAYCIPCHRVIRQNGELGGYRWGIACKRNMLHHEQGIKTSALD